MSMDKRLAALESEDKRLGFIEIPNYSDEERAALIVEVFQRHEHSQDPEVQWRLRRITEILEEARVRRDEELTVTAKS